MRPTNTFALSLAAAFLVGCASDHTLATAPASPTVLTGAYTAFVLPLPDVHLPGVEGCGFATVINASGAVAGTSCSFSDQGENVPLAWSATAHVATLLPSAPLATIITGISDNGTIVGNDFSLTLDASEALEWKNGSVDAVDSGGSDPLHGSESTFAHFICATDCTIVGSFRAAPTSSCPLGSSASIWTTGGFRVDVAAPPGAFGAEFVAIGGGFIFGNLFDENCADTQLQSGSSKPARWGAHGWELLPNPNDASLISGSVTSANARGDAVGIVDPGTVVLWPITGAPVEIVPPEGYSSFVPLQINASGLVVGYLVGSSPSFATDAAYWTSQAGFRLLPSGAGGHASGVNDRGEIVGFSAGDGLSSGTPMFWEPVPAP
jgi:hypothetical protein